jgi:hypothetical protein
MYFLTLGELGTAGIVTLLMLIFGNIRANNRVRRNLGADAERGSVSSMNRTLVLMNAGMLGFAVAGTFLSVSYYPHIFVLTGLFLSARSIAAAECVDGANAATRAKSTFRRGGAPAKRRQIRQRSN